MKQDTDHLQSARRVVTLQTLLALQIAREKYKAEGRDVPGDLNREIAKLEAAAKEAESWIVSIVASNPAFFDKAMEDALNSDLFSDFIRQELRKRVDRSGGFSKLVANPTDVPSSAPVPRVLQGQFPGGGIAHPMGKGMCRFFIVVTAAGFYTANIPLYLVGAAFSALHCLG